MPLEGAATDSAFTLVELMVVMVIIGILLAIAVPIFLNVQTGAQNRLAEANLRNSLTAAKTYFTVNNTYASATRAGFRGSSRLLTSLEAPPRPDLHPTRSE